MAKGYIVGLLKFTNHDQFIENYAKRIPSVIEANGGRFLVRTPESHFAEGREYSLHVIVEFESFLKAREMLKSPEFINLQLHRHNNTDRTASSFMLLEGGDVLKK
ncbi:MAG: DUF1330 domain-containing protein [Alphaproteobacteria bacterium]